MAKSRREFLRGAVLTGAAIGLLADDSPSAQRGGANQAMPTERANTFMAKFGLRYPLVQSPAGGAELAAAISNAGGMGHLTLWGGTPESARQNVASLRVATKQRFVGNYVLTFEPRSLGAALDAGLPVVQFSWGIPTASMASAVRKAGAMFGVQVGTALAARSAIDAGVDYLVAQGVEAGGHVQSSTPLYELLPLVLKEAGQTPVIVAGGISTGLHLRRALAAGASGAIVGTRFMATQESTAHADYKRALVNASGDDAAMSVCYSDGWPAATHRTLRNGTLNRWEAAGCPAPGSRPGEGDVVATRANGSKVLRYSIGTPSRGLEGAVTDMAMYAGQGVGDVKDVPPVRDLMARIWTECVETRPVR
jgi:nitronate monooxygenase